MVAVPSTVWMACGAKSDGAGPDGGGDAAKEAALVDGAPGAADAFQDAELSPDRDPDAIGEGFLDDAAVAPPANDGSAETGAAIGTADADADAGASDPGRDAMTDSGNGDRDASSQCSSYCAAVMAACTGANAQYKGTASCMTACPYLDGLACRITHAGYALTAPNPHCWHAGPLGYGFCSPNYDGFCRIAAGPRDTYQAPSGFCSSAAGFDAGPAAYSSYSECLLRASGYAQVNMETNVQPPGRVGLDGGFNANGPAAGNTLDCRAYHLVLALQGGSAQQTECNNVGPTSPTCQ